MMFHDAVTAAKREAKGEASAEEIAWLAHHPEMWIQALRAAVTDASHQFDQQRERIDRARRDAESGLISIETYQTAIAEHDAWSRKASRYRSGIEQRLAEIEARASIDSARLRDAIARHREARGSVPTDHIDAELWATIEMVATAVSV